MPWYIDWGGTTTSTGTISTWCPGIYVGNATTATSTAYTNLILPIYQSVWVDQTGCVTNIGAQLTHEQYFALAQERVAVYRERTAEELRQEAERIRIARQERLRREHEAAEAKARSRELLLAHLTPSQRATFEKRKWFIVEGGASGVKYRIRDLGHLRANVEVLRPTDDMPWTVDHRLCCHADEYRVPLYDNLLAQKVALESDESYFLRIANRHAA